MSEPRVRFEVEGKVAMRSTNGQFLRDAAIRGEGMVMQPSFILHEAVEAGTLEPVFTDYHWPTVTIFVVYPQTRHLSARARALMEYLRNRIGARPDWEGFLDRD